MFLLASIHALLVILYYHLGGPVNPITNIFTSSPLTGDLAWIPFQAFGFVALIILFFMAATSHDFWLANLTAPVWKALHMLVYVAYALLILHVVFGILQSEQSPIYVVFTGLGLVAVLGLHGASGLKETAFDKKSANLPQPHDDGFVAVGETGEIQENRAKIVTLGGERVAIFKYRDEDDGDKLKIAAISNVCQHQNGPLGEGIYFKGCITCPWHSFQYKPHDGASPPPFTEKVPTFDVRLDGEKIFVCPTPNIPGAAAQTATIA